MIGCLSLHRVIYKSDLCSQGFVVIAGSLIRCSNSRNGASLMDMLTREINGTRCDDKIAPTAVPICDSGVFSNGIGSGSFPVNSSPIGAKKCHVIFEEVATGLAAQHTRGVYPEILHLSHQKWLERLKDISESRTSKGVPLAAFSQSK
jgi:hypothetical protein